MTRTFRGLAPALAVIAVLAVGACSDKGSERTDTSDRPTVEVTAQPKDPELARVIMEQVFNNLNAGDWSGAWELWTQSAKTAVTRDAYVNLMPTCTTAQGGAYEITDVSPVDDSTVTVKWKHTPAKGAEVDGASTVKYQEGAWRYEPDAAVITAYKANHCS